MKVIGFSGKSGTGKSFLAIKIAKQNNADAIIDDGILIHNGSIIGGESAKKQSNTMTAIKTALFENKEYREDVSKAFKKYKIKSVLILGTSDRMVDKIANKLGLPKVSKYIHIEDVASKDEIKNANKNRKTLGTHSIPVHRMKIKEDFSGFWVKKIRRLFTTNKTAISKDNHAIIRPTYSYLGDFIITKKIIRKIILITLKEENNIILESIKIDDSQDLLDIRITLKLKQVKPFIKDFKSMHVNIVSALIKMTSIEVKRIKFVVI